MFATNVTRLSLFFSLQGKRETISYAPDAAQAMLRRSSQSSVVFVQSIPNLLESHIQDLAEVAEAPSYAEP